MDITSYALVVAWFGYELTDHHHACIESFYIRSEQAKVFSTKAVCIFQPVWTTMARTLSKPDPALA